MRLYQLASVKRPLPMHAAWSDAVVDRDPLGTNYERHPPRPPEDIRDESAEHASIESSLRIVRAVGLTVVLMLAVFVLIKAWL